MSRITRIVLVPFMGLLGCEAVEYETRGEPFEAIAEAVQDDDDDDDDEAADELDESASDDLQAPRESSEAPPPFPEALLVSGAAAWTYFERTSNCGVLPQANWRTALAPMLNNPLNGAWKTGRAELGYGDGDEVTVIAPGGNPNADQRCITQYFRHEFDVGNAALYNRLVIRLLRDDGAVVYINGAEVRRDNLPAGTILDTTRANASVSDSDEDRFTPTNVNLPLAPVPVSPAFPFRTGINIIAVEVHNRAPNNTDLSFNLELLARLGTTPAMTTRRTSVVSSTEATIEEGHANEEFGGDSACKVDGSDDSGNDQVCLAQWNLANANPAIPAGALIRAAHLDTNITNGTPDRFQVYPIDLPDMPDVDWLENAVNWNDPNGSVAGDWIGGTTFGLATLLPPVSLVSNASNTGERLIPLPASLVQGWIGMPPSADGLAIFNTRNTNGVDFAAGGAGLELVITYDVPSGP